MESCGSGNVKLGDDILVIKCRGNLPNKDSWTFSIVIFFILESLNEIWFNLSEIWMNYFLHVSYSVVIRDKVGNSGQFDDKTLFGNESNLHTKIAFTHNISR